MDTNVGAEPAEALLTLHYDNGGKKYELQQTIAPGDQMWVNLSQLVRQGVPDRSGNLLPAGTTAVTYDLQDLTPGGHSLTANDLAVNSTSGRVVPECFSCCGWTAESFFPNPVNLDFGFYADIGVNGLNPCNGQKYNITTDFDTWTSSNTSIAMVTTGSVQGVGVGTATGFAEGTINSSGQCACNPKIVEVQVPIHVAPTISGPNTVWYFNNLAVSGYATSIQLTSSGGSSTTWTVTAGANKINVSSYTGSSITVMSSGTAFSLSAGDVKITATANGVDSSPFSLTTRTPSLSVPGTITNACDPTWGYLTTLNYTIKDQLTALLPSGVPVNENWTTGVANDYNGTNWRQSIATGVDEPGSAFADTIGGENLNLPPNPVPTCDGNNTAVEHWGQEFRVGSTVSGIGRRIQTDSLQKYVEHAAHVAIVSPAP